MTIVVKTSHTCSLQIISLHACITVLHQRHLLFPTLTGVIEQDNQQRDALGLLSITFTYLEYHRLGGFNSRIHFLTIVKAANGPGEWGWRDVRSSIRLQMAVFLLSFHMAESEFERPREQQRDWGRQALILNHLPTVLVILKEGLTTNSEKNDSSK